jgi:hypothetical protein
MRVLRNTTACLVFAAFAATATAECKYGQSGYIFVASSCVQDRIYGDPDNICEIPRTDANGASAHSKSVLFISNVIFDDGSNRRLPIAQWNDETLIQHNIGGQAMGQVSSCFGTYDEAVDAMRGRIASHKRSFSDGIVRSVAMDDS